MPEQITLYTNKISPFGHKVEIALKETGADYIRYEVDISKENKPAWYTEKVNPMGKVPAIAYGAQPSPDKPSAESFKLSESSVIIQFLAEVFPASPLLPSDPFQRSKARLFATVFELQVLRACNAGLTSTAGIEGFAQFFSSLDTIQSLLPDSGARYAISDDFTIADVIVAPWLGARIDIALKNDLGTNEKGAALKAYEIYQSPKYEKLRNYAQRLRERPSVRETYLEDVATEYYSKVYARK